MREIAFGVVLRACGVESRVETKEGLPTAVCAFATSVLCSGTWGQAAESDAETPWKYVYAVKEGAKSNCSCSFIPAAAVQAAEAEWSSRTAPDDPESSLDACPLVTLPQREIANACNE